MKLPILMILFDEVLCLAVSMRHNGITIVLLIERGDRYALAFSFSLLYESPTVMELPTYRTYLFEEYQRRNGINPGYSLRAYARDLSLSPSRLSEIFSKKNGLSPENANRIAGLLKLEPQEREVFHTSVLANHARSPKCRKEANAKLLKLAERPQELQMKREEFRVIADWYHLSILELLSLKEFLLTPKSVSEKLEITIQEAKCAIDRLIELGWIRKVNGKFVTNDSYRTINSPVHSKAIRSYHTQMIQKAERSIQFQSTENRDLHGLVLAIEKKNLPKAKKLLNDFCAEFNRKMGVKTGEGESVYALTLQFFEITQTKQETSL